MQQDVQAEVRRLQQLERTEVPAGRCRVETGPEFMVDLGPIDSWLYAAAFFRRMALSENGVPPNSRGIIISFPFRCLPLDKPMPTMHVDHESLQKWQRPWGHDSFPCQNQNQAMSWYTISGRHHIIEDERQRMSLGDNPTFLLIIEPWSPTFGFDSLIVKSPCSAPHSTHLGLCESKVAPDLMADHYYYPLVI